MDYITKTRILFVDDEPSLLQGLRRMLRPMRDRWDMTFLNSTAEAIQLLEESVFDILITDLMIPVSNGVKLLETVKANYPHMIRLVLSGHVNKGFMYQAIELAHQFITKPCDADALKSIIRRSTALHGILQSEIVKEVVGEMDVLPSLPTLYIKVMEELKAPDASLAKVGEIISGDVAMSAKTLQLVNSAFFGLPRQINSIKQATVYLGMDTIRSLVLSTQIFSSMSDEEASQFNLDQLWKHSQNCAAGAKAIAISEACTQESITHSFMAGMFHDIGKVILAANMTGVYQQILRTVENDQLSQIEAEEKILSVTHAEIGGYLLGLWGFHDPLVEAVCLHHHPELSPDDTFSPLTAVHVTNAFEAARNTHDGESCNNVVNEKYLDRIGLLDRLPKWQAKYNELIEKG